MPTPAHEQPRPRPPGTRRRAIWDRREVILWAGLTYCLLHTPDLIGQLGSLISAAGTIGSILRS